MFCLKPIQVIQDLTEYNVRSPDVYIYFLCICDKKGRDFMMDFKETYS